VHLNWPLRDPLVASEPVGPAPGGRSDGRPWVSVARPAPGPAPLAEQISTPARGLIVAGREDAGLSPAIPDLAEACGYPLLADPLSGAPRPQRDRQLRRSAP
jgi:2-succinyl-5-enolpyruvyl-6-hydroxy-3-cyclohexene-1-carboxylate synthase